MPFFHPIRLAKRLAFIIILLVFVVPALQGLI
jgi:hypothetical protein